MAPIISFLVYKPPKIDFSKDKRDLDKIKIVDSNKNLEEPISLLGLFDPEQNDLNLDMWSSTNGDEVEKIINFPTIKDLFLHTDVGLLKASNSFYT